ncbi:MAG: methionyl-tRNA formyltransferase [Chloroflexi bacterium]|jgi:methionyl-tRNA formyltransferase|nr:methionyl-tRNA formyltransferase [Chloroflexota bacterium]
MARVVFFGTPEFALPALRALINAHEVVAVVTQPDRKVGRGRRRLETPPVKALAQTQGIEVLQPERLRRDRDALERLCALEADVFVLAAYGQILPQSVLETAPHGCIGVHASLLPLLRGAAPIARAILEGHEHTGITLMLTDAGMDTGPIIAQAELEIDTRETTATLTTRLAALGAALLGDTLPAWLRGELKPRPQDDCLASQAPPISRQEAAIDWSQRAVAIDRQVRAFDPWPGAYTTLHGQLLKILAASVSTASPGGEEPGTVLALADNIGVATGKGVLQLERLQLAGKRAMDAAALARGRDDLIGARLGERP